jgi:hypothetical protein
LLYFSSRVSLLCIGQPGLWTFYLCLPHIWSDRCHHTQIFIGWDGVSLTVFPAGLEPWFVILLIFTSQVARITGLSHCTQIQVQILLFYFLRYWGLKSGPIPWATPPILFFVLGIFEIRSHELFA